MTSATHASRSLRPSRAGAALLATLLGCGGGGAPPAAPPAEPVLTAMDDHFTAITAMQAAMVAGDLPLARRHARALAGGLRDRDHPAGWAAQLDEVRDAVWRVARAEELKVAAVAVADAGRACGGCHAAHAVEVVSADPEVPAPPAPELGDFMRRHRWATEQLWLGLIGPSPEAWSSGATVLAETGLFPSDLALGDDAEMRRLAAQLDQLVLSAADAGTPSDRAAFYGALLGTCAACHRHYLDAAD